MNDSSFLNSDLFKPCPSCGATVDSDTIVSKSSYSIVGWFFWSMGTTVIPKKILFTCSKCNIIVDELKNKKVIEHYITYKKY